MSEKADAKPGPPPGPSPWTLMFLILLTFWMCNRPPDPKLGLQQCGKSLHAIGVALERFRLSSEDQTYPKDLQEAYKGSAPPACPIGGKSTYSAGYQPGSDRRSYLLVCKGDHHQKAGVPSDYPRIAFGPHEAKPAGEESPGQSSSPSPSASATPSPKATGSAQPAPTPAATGKAGATATPNP